MGSRRQIIMLVIKSKGSYFVVKKSPRDTDVNNLHSTEQTDNVKGMKNADLMDKKKSLLFRV